MAPESVTVSVPLLITSPAPASTALTVPFDRANIPDDDSVPFWIVPPVSVTPPFWVWLVPPRSSVPPDTVVELATAPSLPLPESWRVPAFTAVLPV